MIHKLLNSTLAIIISSTLANAGVEKFVIPAINDTLIFENSTISNSQSKLETRLTIGEPKSLSFVLKSSTNLNNLTLNIGNLSGDNGTIQASNLDISIVKNWYQYHQNTNNNGYTRVLEPELLLKDESGLVAQNDTNMLRDINGDYINISEYKASKMLKDISFKDATTLKPFGLSKNKNKQFWITLKIPKETKTGIYTGKISLKSGMSTLSSIDVKVEVLPFILSTPLIENHIYYDSALNHPNIAYKRDTTALLGELQNLQEHLSNPMISENISSLDNFKSYLQLRKDAKFDTSKPLYIQESYNFHFNDTTVNKQTELDNLTQRVKELITLIRAEGFSGDVYLYGTDEPTSEKLLAQRDIWNAIHEGGAKVFCALSTEQANYEEIKSMADILDLAIVSYKPDALLADEYHKHNHKIGTYANPQAGKIAPNTYRKNYGLYLWQNNYDFASTWAYQGHDGVSWNVFDYNDVYGDGSKKSFYDESFTYPATNGAINTIEWEGWRESVIDTSYLSTLLEFIEKAKSEGKDTSVAQAFVNELKVKNLDNENMNTIREEMIDNILSLQSTTIQNQEEGIFSSISNFFNT